MAKVKNNEYGMAMLGNSPELLNAGDGADISNEPDVGVRGAQRKEAEPVEEVEEVEGEEIEEGEEEYEEVEASNVPDPVEPTAKEIVYKKDQVQKIVQTRVGTIQKQIDKLQPYKVAFEQMAEITGMDTEALIHKLNNMPISEQAAILGMKPEEVTAARTARTELNKQKKTTQSLQRQLQEAELKTNASYGDMDLFKDEMDVIIEANPNLTLKQAYTLAKGDTGSAAVRDAEQRVVNKQVSNSRKKVVKVKGAGASDGSPKFDAGIIAAANKVGMSPLEYAQYSEVSNIDQYRALKARGKSKK